jgi:hypothetical protein
MPNQHYIDGPKSLLGRIPGTSERCYDCCTRRLFPAQTGTAAPRVKVTGEPLSLTLTMSGSLPTLSWVVPPDEVEAVPGNVTGMETAQVLPFAVTVTPVMDWPLEA